jgi:hypothetical protein
MEDKTYETRYINFQNPGNKFGGCNTPLNRILMSMSNETRPDAVSAFGSAAIVMSANVDA